MANQLDCPHCGNADVHAKKGHRIPPIFDGVLFWECLACGKAYPRIFVGASERANQLREASRNNVIEWNRRRG